jgi:hypothetical protein
LDKRPKLKKMDTRFDTWYIISLYKAGSLMTVAKGISKYKLDLVAVQKPLGSVKCWGFHE